MQLSLEQIKNVTYGVENIAEDNGKIRFYRYNDEQISLYSERYKDVAYKCYATAGVRISLETDSIKGCFSYEASAGSSRDWGALDIYENNVLVGHYMTKKTSIIEFELSEGRKHVEIYFPWSQSISISNFRLNGEFCEPVPRKYKIINYGDSITHGYDTVYPSLSYAVNISKLLDADCINKGWGGDIFFADLVKADTNTDAQYVTVAYGTNDWRSCSYEQFVFNCEEFMKALCDKYKNSKIFAITPIWRANKDNITNLGCTLDEASNIIRKISEKYPKINLISGMSLVPHNEGFFMEDMLHPNTLGFTQYTKNLMIEIEKYI